MRMILVVTLLVGCASKKPPAEQTGSAAPVAAAPADAAHGDAAVAKRAAATPAQLADYRKHMKAGWKAQKAHKWADATTEFEAAAKILDGDQRALSELGWSAMNAGDFKKARLADDDAVRVAIDPKVKAASLYNLGLVQAKTGDAQHAAVSFRESLKLRPNKTVEAELAKLGAAVANADAPSCEAGTPVCQCVFVAANDELEDDWSERCKESTTVKAPPLPGFHVYETETRNGHALYLTDEHDQIVTQIGGGDDRMRSTMSVTLDKMEVRTVAGHKVLWIETTNELESTYMTETSFDEGNTTSQTVTICDVGDAKRPTKCLDDLVASFTETSDTGELDPDTGDYKPGRKTTSKGLDNNIAIGDDGVVTVKLVKGAPDEWIQQMLGPHVLWR